MQGIKLAVLLMLTVFGVGGCSGRDFALLLPGAGPGSYSGTLTGAATGNFDLRVRESGQLSGSGLLGAFPIELRGVLEQSGQVVAFITERDSQRTGEFDGVLNGAQLSGTWRFDPTGAQVIQGDWTAVLNP